ncbi:MAG TPA: hypothetical protein VF476_06650, partial [Chitinophagaceae bacterium]
MRSIPAFLALLCIQLITKPMYAQFTANPANSGTVSYSTVTSNGNFSSAILRATANAGYAFSGVFNYVDQWGYQRSGGSYGSNTLTLNNRVQKAEGIFLKLYSISAVSSPADAGTITGTGPNPETKFAALTANPAPGYGLKNWTIGGTEVSTAITYNHTVSKDTTVTANFTKL